MNIFLRISFLLCLFCIGSIAQEQIDVESMTIAVSRTTLSSSFNLVVKNANNQKVTYAYHDSTALSFGSIEGIPYAAMCFPCRNRGVYSTLGWQFPSFYASLGGMNSNLRAKITFSDSAVTSDRIALRPFHSKRIAYRGKTKFPVAKVEILDFLTVIAVDNDVILDGNYTLYFRPEIDLNGNKIVFFDGITYSFDEPRN
jgi:hypothetical protein